MQNIIEYTSAEMKDPHTNHLVLRLFLLSNLMQPSHVEPKKFMKIRYSMYWDAWNR